MLTFHDRTAFTLVETMVATSIASIMLTATVSTILFCHSMFRRTMTEAESSLAAREIRDKLLFHAGVKQDGSRLDDGLLTGKWKLDSASLTMNWSDSNDGPENIRIILKSDSKGNYFYNERCPHTSANDKWFRPSNFRIGVDWSSAIVDNYPDNHPLKVGIIINLLDPVTATPLNTITNYLPRSLEVTE